MKPTAIITGDIGLQEGQPVCRLDNYWDAQARKIKWLRNLQQKYECPIFDGGDLFEHWKSSPYLLQWALENLPEGLITVPGNHDLPAHNIELYKKSGLAVLEAAKRVEVLLFDGGLELLNGVFVDGYPWGSTLGRVDPSDTWSSTTRQVALVHTMCYNGRSPWPGCTDPSAKQVLQQMGGYDLIVVGHNHKPFIVQDKGRILISPGSLTRTTADQMDYEPHVYLWYAETNVIEPIPVPIEQGVITRAHIDKANDRDERIDAFVAKIKGSSVEIGLSFHDNLAAYFATKRTRTAVKDIVYECLEKEKFYE